MQIEIKNIKEGQAIHNQNTKDLAAIFLFIISLLWIFGTAGASDLNTINLGQCALQLGIGIIGLYISAKLIQGGENGKKKKRAQMRRQSQKRAHRKIS